MTDKGNFQKSVQEREKNFSCASHNNLRNIISSLFLLSYFCVKDDSRIVRGPKFFLVKEIGVKLVRYGHYAMEFDKICGTKRRHFVNQSLIYHMHILKEKRENDDLHSFTLNTGKGIKNHGER